MEIKGTPAPGGQHHVQHPIPPDQNAKLTPDQQTNLDRFRRIEARDEQTAYAWIGFHGRNDSPMQFAYQALLATVGQQAINDMLNKYGQSGKGASFGPSNTGRQGYIWAYHPSDHGGDFQSWEQTFDHSSSTIPPPNIAAVVVSVQ